MKLSILSRFSNGDSNMYKDRLNLSRIRAKSIMENVGMKENNGR